MRKLLFIFAAMLLSSIGLHASNTITYYAPTQLSRFELNVGATTFGPAITSHDFSNGKGTIICNGEITKIGESAFEDCFKLTSITIPSSVTTIGDWAFYACTSLTSVTIPNSVTTIGARAFNKCTGLTSIEIPSSVTTIGESAFRECTSLTSVAIPNSVTTIGKSAFEDCTGLTSIEIPSSVTTIGDWAFEYCGSLISVTVNWTNAQSIVSININVFIGIANGAGPEGATLYVPEGTANLYKQADVWKNFSKITVPTITYTASEKLSGAQFNIGATTFGSPIKSHTFSNGIGVITCAGLITKIADGAFTHSGITSITLPSSITQIGMGAFEYCGQLQSITLPPSLSVISNGSFQNTGLTSITIPASVERIDAWAFQECPNLKEVIIPSSSRLTSIEGYAFSNCSALTSIIIPNSVTKIGERAFWGCGLTSVTIPASVKEIGFVAFKNCTQLKDLQFAEREDVIDIGTYVFENVAIEDVVIPDWMTVIPEGLFYANSKLEGIYLHEGVQKFNYRPFGKCNNLKYIISMPTTPPEQDRDAFEDLNDTVYVYVPSEDAKTKYENDPKWKQHKFVFFLDSITYKKISNTDVEVSSAYPINGRISVPAVVTLKDTLYNVAGIGNNAIKDQTELQHLILPPTMKNIGDNALEGCTNLIDVKLPVELQTIGEKAFYGCSALDSIAIPEGVQTIGKRAFMDCSKLTSVTLPTGLKNIPDECFRRCPLGQEIIVPEGVETIGEYAFEGINEAKMDAEHLTLPSTLKELNLGAFFFHDGLKDVTCLATTPPTLKGQAFAEYQYQKYKDEHITVYVPNRDVLTTYKSSAWGADTYQFKFADLMAEANKQYLRTLAGSNDTAKTIANAYCDSIDNRATTTQQVQDYTNTAAMMMDKYVLPDYKERLCDALDSIAKTVLNAQSIADDYKQRIMDTHFRGEAENLFVEGCAKIDALKQLYDLKRKCKNALWNMAQDNQNAKLMADTYAELIDGAATQEEVYQLYEEGKKRIAKTLFIDEYWIDIDGCYYLGGFIEEK